jgi:hypothetical protein
MKRRNEAARQEMKDFRGEIAAPSLKLMEIEPIRTHRD